MPFVLDVSIAACWAFQDEDHPYATVAFARIRGDEAIVPSLWWFEVRNALVINERRKRITESQTSIFLRDLSRFLMRVDRLPEEAQLLYLARTHRLSVYDAAYLELAQRERIPLATLDVKLAAAAHAENVPLIGPPR
jgi:predicted nucleic acid-binding protein